MHYYEGMKRTDNKSHCPVNFGLEAFGDNWSLLIVRDIVFWGKRTYGDFLSSREGIATNMLARRLAELQAKGIIQKHTDEADKRKELYSLTEKGLALIPVLLEIAGWSAHNDPHTNAPKEFVEYVYGHRDKMFALITDTVRDGGAVFVGENSVLSKMQQKEK